MTKPETSKSEKAGDELTDAEYWRKEHLAMQAIIQKAMEILETPNLFSEHPDEDLAQAARDVHSLLKDFEGDGTGRWRQEKRKP